MKVCICLFVDINMFVCCYMVERKAKEQEEGVSYSDVLVLLYKSLISLSIIIFQIANYAFNIYILYTHVLVLVLFCFVDANSNSNKLYIYIYIVTALDILFIFYRIAQANNIFFVYSCLYLPLYYAQF